jgi:hypothetical protein
MQVIDVDSHVTVPTRFEGTSYQVDILPDGGHAIEFNRTGLNFAPANGKFSRLGRKLLRPGSFGISTIASKISIVTESPGKC